jgi:hypothetical protein
MRAPRTETSWGKKEKQKQRQPLDWDVRVLDLKAMRKGWKRRIEVVKEEVKSDLEMMESSSGLWDGDSDVGEGSAGHEEETNSSDSVSDAAKQAFNTPPTPWMDGAEADGTEDTKTDLLPDRANDPAIQRPQAGSTTSPASSNNTSSSSGKTYDPDEMVRREPAFLPAKHTREPQCRFG